MLDQIKAQSEVHAKRRDIYKPQPSLSACSERNWGTGPVRPYSISRHRKMILCDASTPARALAPAAANLDTRSTVVLDLVALTTLRLLGITRQVLTSGGFRFVIAAATCTELQELHVKARFVPDVPEALREREYLAGRARRQAVRQALRVCVWIDEGGLSCSARSC